jgi:hypothetical protein
MGFLQDLFGGADHAGFFGGGYHEVNNDAYNLPGFEQMGQNYTDLANQQMGRHAVQHTNMVNTQANPWAGVAGGQRPVTTTSYEQTGPDWRADQGQLAQSMFGTLAGNTPSVAQEQLRQSTAQNIANTYAMAQARGGPNASRLAALGAGNMNQQAAGQAAMLRAQEIQNAQAGLSGLLGNARGQDTQGALGFLGQNLQAAGMQQAGAMGRDQAQQAALGNAQQNALGGKILSGVAGAVAGAVGGPGAGAGAAAGMSGKYKGGEVGPRCAACGGEVPGYAHGGDSAKNDTVQAMLSPGEIVLPRSVTLDEDAPELARAFVEAIKQKRAKTSRRLAA